MSALAALNRARAAWEASQPQFQIDLYPDARALGEVAPAPSPEPPHGATSPSARAFTPGAEPHRDHSPVAAVDPVTVPPEIPLPGGSAPSTPAEEVAVSDAPTNRVTYQRHSESSASAGHFETNGGSAATSPQKPRGAPARGV